MRGLLAFLFVVGAAVVADAQCVKETSGNHWYPGRLRTGPTTCSQLETSSYCSHEPGVWVFCQDCLPTCPVTCCVGPCIGAHCFRDGAAWGCLNSTGACVNVVPTTTTTTAPPTTTTSTTAASTTTVTATTTSSTTTATGATTTSTTTSTTTTTVSSGGDSVSFLWAFGPPNQENVNAGEVWDGANTLFCNAWIPEIGIDNATSITFGVRNGAGQGGVAIYQADGTRVTTTGSRALPGVITTTSASFNINAGEFYWVCSCSTDTNIYDTAHPGSTSNSLKRLQNALTGTPLDTLGSQTCTSGAPPVGPLTFTANPTARSPIMLLLGTNTP